MIIEKLKARWQDLVRDTHPDLSVSDNLFKAIVTAYSETHRAYHNLTHLEHFFSELDTCQSNEPLSNELLWAVWYHDFIYKPGSKTNEIKSTKEAELAMEKLKIAPSSINKVIKLIIATENHKLETSDSETQLFLDADMAILGSDEINYLNYCKAIRKEHATIPDFLFNPARKKFLLSVLEQETIFMSTHFKDKYELSARKNIKYELSKLRN